jgi:FAD-dependent sensor of blue light
VLDSSLSSLQMPVSHLPGQSVDRLLYASLCCVNGPVFEEMHRIRDHALERNVADDVYVALLYQAGWFMQWMEGPAAGVRAAMRRVARDPRHRNLRLLHLSRGQRRLTQPWSMAYTQEHEQSADFQRRATALREKRSHEPSDPASVWRRLSMPLNSPAGAGSIESDCFQRVMVCSARGTESFDLVHWLGQANRRRVMSHRLAGAQAEVRDVATHYVDLDGGPGEVVRRVVAMARNGLHIGLTQAFLPDYSHLIVLLSGEANRDADLINMLVASCWRLSHRPVLVGVAPAGCAHAALRDVAREGGLVYLDCDLGGRLGPAAMWAVTVPALDLSLGAHPGGSPCHRQQVTAATPKD